MLLLLIDETIYVTTEKGNLVTFDQNGNLLWENKEAGFSKFYSEPVKYENLIFLATIDRGIQVFESESGELVNKILPEKKDAIYILPF